MMTRIEAQEHPCALNKQKSMLSWYAKAATIQQQELMEQYDVKYHHLDVKVERDTTYISGSVRTLAQIAATQMDTFGFELYRNLTIDSIEVPGGTNLAFSRVTDFTYVRLPLTLTKNQFTDLTIYYHGIPPKGASAAIGAGFSSASSTRWGNRATWSLSQPYSAYEWWPCKQSLQDKIDSVRVHITTSSANKAGSQGVLQQVVGLPNGKVRYEWLSHYPISAYLISVAVAQYVEYKTYAVLHGDTVLIQDYIYSNPATLDTLKPILDKTSRMMESFSELFGDYPFKAEKYGHAMAPFSGGMEHQTMTSIGIINFNIVAHELGHQWWGDHVTCATWRDIWLNEGFASYSEYLANEHLDSLKAAPLMQQVHNRVMSEPGGSIWFTDTTDVGRIFSSRLTYDKGNAFVHILRFETANDSLFFAALKTYHQTYAFSNANTLQFKQVLEQVTGRDFTRVFNQWFYGEGFPTFHVRWNHLNDTLYMEVTQTTSTAVTPLFVTPVEYLIWVNNTTKLVRFMHDSVTCRYKIPLTGMIGSVQVDPKNWLLNSSTSTQDYTLGVDDAERTRLRLDVYPNPANDVVTLVSHEQEGVLQLRDAAGRKIRECAFTSKLSLDGLESGMYFLTLVSGRGEKTIYLIKR